MTKKEAIETIKTTMPYMWKETKEAIQTLIPELAECEDEKIRKTLIHIVKGACDKYGIKYRGDEINEEKLLAYLEKQKEQKPAEWSKEEQTIIEGACNALEIHGHSKLADNLKSLPPQSHWKPSEEQMKALENAMDRNDKIGYILRTLYDDIKKI